MNVAGVKKIPNKGEENIRVIWPNEKPAAYNERNRSLDSSGIDQTGINLRRARL